MTSFASLRRFDLRIRQINGTVQSPFNGAHFLSFQEISCRKNIIGIIHNFLRKNVLNLRKVQVFEVVCQLLAVSFSLEHCCSDKEGSLDRIRFSRYSGLESYLESPFCIRVDNLLSILFSGAIFQVSPLGPLPAATLGIFNAAPAVTTKPPLTSMCCR